MSRRALQVGSTVLAGALVGAALVALPAQDPQGDASAGPVGPALPAGGPPGATPPPHAEVAPDAQPPAEVAPAPVPVDEDWLDAHLRQARGVWTDAAAVAATHPSAAVQGQSAAMATLAEAAPAATDELPPLPVMVPYLADELTIWLEIAPVEADFPALAAHMAPLIPSEIALEASRDPARVP